MSAAPHPQLRQRGSAQDPGHPSAAVPGRCWHEGVLFLSPAGRISCPSYIAGNVPLGSPPHRAPGQADGVLLADPLAGDELVLELIGTQSNGTWGGTSFNLSKGIKPLIRGKKHCLLE